MRISLTKNYSPTLLKDKIKEIFSSYKESRDEILVNCPYCVSRISKIDTKKHLYINVYKNRFNCFRCEARGLATSFFPGIQYYFDAAYSVNDNINKEELTTSSLENIPDNVASIDLLDEDHPALLYLKKRIPHILDIDLPIYYCNKYIRSSNDFGERIIFPIFSEKNYYGFQARSINENIKEFRYINSLNFDKSSYLYNFENVKNNKRIIITEGIFDCLMCGSDAVCIFGKSLSPKQKSLIIENEFEEIIIFLDKDALKSSIFMAKSLLKSYSKIYYVFYNKKDPGSCSIEEINYLLNTLSFRNSYGKIRVY